MNAPMRRILVVLVTEHVEEPQWMLVPAAMTMADLLGRLLDPRVRGSEAAADERPENFRLFDWSGRSLPADVRVREVPLPGIVTAVLRSGPKGKLFAQSDEVNVWLFRQTLMRDETSMGRLSRFLASPDATVPAAPLRNIDVFVSYAFHDSALAAEVVGLLRARGLDVFLAESSLAAGRQWREQIREAVRSARRAVLLVTPTSARSPWVLAEAGALAWARTPTIALLEGVAHEALPGPLRSAMANAPARAPEQWLDEADYRTAPAAAQPS